MVRYRAVRQHDTTALLLENKPSPEKAGRDLENNGFWNFIHITNLTIMEAITECPVVVTDMKKKVRDIQMAISWRDFANTYFQRSSSWFYHKMDGIDGNGGEGGFNEEEVEQMRGALIDLSNRIRRVAETI